MSSPKFCILRAPGTNCDLETARAFELAGGIAERVHLFRLLEKPELLADFQGLCIPGGFSYGDDIGSGVIFSRQLQYRLSDTLADFLQADKLALGICNGFQVLLKSGLLPNGIESFPAPESTQPEATLTWNLNGQYTALWVNLKVRSTNSVFFRGIDEIEMPIAHAEGKIAVRDPSILTTWKERDQIAVAYHPLESDQPVSDEVLEYPINPNGSIANIAGLTDPTGRILGLMPHPERFLFATQHPQWTRKQLSGDGDGLKLFQNAVQYFC
jgi:phosphoribosylformylglycinamidine synthase subunit PurQ / glutaminase